MDVPLDCPKSRWGEEAEELDACLCSLSAEVLAGAVGWMAEGEGLQVVSAAMC